MIDGTTPRPWTECSWDPMERPHVYRSVAEHNHGHDVAQSLTQPDAALVVRAVNNHYRLTATLTELESAITRYMVDIMRVQKGVYDDTVATRAWERLNNAIKQARAALKEATQ